MKMIKTQLRGHLGEANLSHLMKIAIESPETLSDEELEQIVQSFYDLTLNKLQHKCSQMFLVQKNMLLQQVSRNPMGGSAKFFFV